MCGKEEQNKFFVSVSAHSKSADCSFALFPSLAGLISKGTCSFCKDFDRSGDETHAQAKPDQIL